MDRVIFFFHKVERGHIAFLFQGIHPTLGFQKFSKGELDEIAILVRRLEGGGSLRRESSLHR
jgi:hypothetical protein